MRNFINVVNFKVTWVRVVVSKASNHKTSNRAFTFSFFSLLFHYQQLILDMNGKKITSGLNDPEGILPYFLVSFADWWKSHLNVYNLKDTANCHLVETNLRVCGGTYFTISRHGYRGEKMCGLYQKLYTSNIRCNIRYVICSDTERNSYLVWRNDYREFCRDINGFCNS